MATFIDNLIHSGPHSLADIRESLEIAKASEIDFVTLLKNHHDYLEESISVLMDTDASDSDKQMHAGRFFKLVEMHGQAEEETLYVQLKTNDQREARLEGYGAQDEHDIAFQLEDELLQMGFQSRWTEEIAAKVKVAATLVQNHIHEEESVMFPLVEKDFSENELVSMREDYLNRCQGYLESETLDPHARESIADWEAQRPIV